MNIAIVTEKGRLTLPAEIRKKAHIRPGTRVEVEMRNNEIIIRPLLSISELAGVFKEYTRGKHQDYEAIRDEVMANVALEIAYEGRE